MECGATARWCQSDPNLHAIEPGISVLGELDDDLIPFVAVP